MVRGVGDEHQADELAARGGIPNPEARRAQTRPRRACGLTASPAATRRAG